MKTKQFLPADSMNFVDYEQSGYGFAAWDIAFYVVCLAGIFILYIYTFQRESTSLGRCQLPLFVSITVDVLFS